MAKSTVIKLDYIIQWVSYWIL